MGGAAMTSMSKSTLPNAGLPKLPGRGPQLRAQDRDRNDIEDADLPAANYDIPSTLEALSGEELLELGQREVEMQRDVEAFFRFGENLMAIREKRLYRQTHHTFKEYCEVRWGMSKTNANRLISAAEVVENLTPMGVILPTNERQTRPLAKLETPEAQQAAWTEAVERSPNGKPTGAIVAAVVDEMVRPPVVEPQRAVHEPPLRQAAAEDVPDDAVDDYVPEFEEVQAAGVGGATVTAGATVWTPSGHEGTVLSTSGRLATVKTVNGARQYEIEKLMVVTGEDEDEEVPSSEFQVPSEDRNSTPTGESIETFVEQTYEFASEEVKAKIIAEHYEKKAAEREARRLEMEARRLAALSTPLPTGKYRCLVIDPPWPVEKIEREVRPNQGAALDYPTMSLEDIQALPIRDLADEGGCHLYLWTTQKFLPAALLMVQAWDFEYQCVMPWVKPSGMTPYSWMYNVEFVVFARRGGLALLQNGLKLSIEAPSEGHSVKPGAFYEKVRKASPEPRLDMFARREREGFAVWGDEVEQAS